MIQKSYSWVQDTIIDFIGRRMEIDRLSQLGYALLRTNELLSGQYSPKQEIIDELFAQIVQEQKRDGGWKDVEETMWALAALKYSKKDQESLNNGYGWLKKQRAYSGGWGRSKRDFARIPVTCRIAILHGNICNKSDFDLILSELDNEVLDPKNTFFLTYKVALPLMAFKKNNLTISNKNQLCKLLSKEQNDDGGYAPWKNHPITSEIHSSAYALMAFLQDSRYDKEAAGIIRWMYESQLSDGSWPSHFIDCGTSIGLLALIETRG